ncbi:MAG: energy transducer TonB [Boseongicola sp.]|nr:energy transducer TonB [Boseongicola sp.]
MEAGEEGLRWSWYISGAGHIAFILAVFFAGPLASDRQSEVVILSEVAILSEQEFAALVPPGAAPQTQTDAPTVVAPEEDEAPSSLAAVAATELFTPRPVEAPESPDMPEFEIDQPALGAEIEDSAPTPLLPPSDIDGTSVQPHQVAAPAPRVAPVPQLAPPPEAETGADLIEASVPDPETPPEQVVEEEAPQAPQEASDRIVTEAEEEETYAVASSMRPRSRPPRPPSPEPDVPDDPPRESETVAALAEADTDSRQVAPRGPPLTRGEKEAFGLAVGNCWNVGSLSTSARATKVVVAFDMQRNGVPVAESIRMVEFLDGSETDAGRAFEAARRAIIRCGSKGFQLPVEKFDQWREVEATFNAEGMQFR